jgi:hypothetical protein
MSLLFKNTGPSFLGIRWVPILVYKNVQEGDAGGEENQKVSASGSVNYKSVYKYLMIAQTSTIEQ